MSKPAYFKHDIGASSDPAIIKMRAKFGSKGYGLFWLVVEYLRGTHDGKSALKDIPLIAYAIREREEELQEFIKGCVDDFGLFKSDGVNFWSDRLCRDIATWDDIGERRQLIGKLGAWKKHHPEEPIPQELAEACIDQGIELDCNGEIGDSAEALAKAVANGKQLPKICHSKILQNQNKNKKKKDIYSPTKFKKPSLEEVQAYCLERNNEVDPQRFIDYYESIGWKVGEKPMRDWKASVRTWERNNGNRSQSLKTRPDVDIRIGDFLKLPMGGSQ